MPIRRRKMNAAPAPSTPMSADERLNRLEQQIKVQTLILEHDFNLDHLMNTVIDSLVNATAAAGATVELIDGEALVTRAISPGVPRAPGSRMMREGSLSGACLRAGQSQYCANSETDARVNRDACRGLGLRSFACTPLLAAGLPVGVLKIMAPETDAFSADDIEMLELFAKAIGGGLAREMAFDAMRRESDARRQLEQSLRTSEARAKHLIDLAGRAIISMSGDGLVTGWNAAAERTFGWTETEALGVNLADLIIPEPYRAMHLAGLERVRRDGPSDKMGQAGEIDALRKDGAAIPIELVVNAAPAGEGWEFIAVLQDITQRRARAELFETAFANAPIGLTLAGLDGGILKVNDAFNAMLGHTGDDLLGRTFASITHPDDMELSIAVIGEMLRGEVPSVRLKKRYLHKDGRAVWANTTSSLVRNGEGEPTRCIVQIEDLTESREAEAKYQRMAENVTDIILTADMDTRVTFVSSACSRILGRATKAMIGLTPRECFPDDDISPLLEAIERAAKGETGVRARWRCRHALTGAEVWLESKPSVIAAEGKPVAYADVIRDVTAVVAQEQALEQARAERAAQAELFAVAFEHAPIGKVLADAQGRVLMINAALTRMTGYSADDMRARNFLAVSHPDDLARSRDQYEKLQRGEISSYQLEKRYLGKSGQTIWARLTASMVRDGSGAPQMIIGQLEDLTERKETEARYRLMAENATDMIVTFDVHGRVTFVSPSCRTILGCEPADLIGRTPPDLLAPEDAAILGPALERAARGERGPSIRWRIRRHDGDGAKVWVESNPSLMSLEGEPVAFVDVIRDVTAIVAQEQALTEARRAAEQATEAKSEFLANMSHEIRTPLTAVIGFNKLLLESPTLPPADHGLAARAGSAGRSLLALINDILDYSKIEAGQLELAMRPAAPRQVAEEALALFEPQAWEKGLELILSVSDAVPQSAMFDPGRLRQVLLNLIGNALKFTERGRIVVRLDHRLSRLLIEVQDTGRGLDAAQQGQLFQRFFQADSSTARRHGGTGLGLAICKALVEVMGGSIDMVSQPGQGATFRFSIMAPPTTGFARLSDGVDPEVASLSGVRVLVVDDNPLNLELADAMLTGAGAEVSLAADGGAALAAAAQRPFDAVLLDIRMPGIDGCEVLEQLRARDGPNRATPVLAFCADGDIGPYRQARFDGFVRKPIDTAELLRSVADAV